MRRRRFETIDLVATVLVLVWAIAFIAWFLWINTR